MVNPADPVIFLDLLIFVLRITVVGVAILTLAGFFGQYGHLFDICDHFRGQYLVLLVVCIIGFLSLREWIWSGAALVFFGLNFVVLSPIFLRPEGWKRGEAKYRLFMANILRANRSYQLFNDVIRIEQPDLIALVEPDQPWLDALSMIRYDYPYWHTAARKDNYGLAILSKHPIRNAETVVLTEKGIPTLIADIEIGNQKVRFLLTHPPPPKNTIDTYLRDQQMERLAYLTGIHNGSTIVCGDFNATPWSKAFRKMTNSGKLVDSSRGFGYQGTWPVNHTLLRVPIDHCLVSSDIVIVDRKIGPPVGSDHFPLIIDFRIDSGKFK